MVKKKEEKIKKVDDKKLFAFIATFLSIIGFVIALLARKDDKYVMFYAKQSLVIFIISAIAGILFPFFSLIPIIGSVIKVGLNIIIFILWLVSWIYALSGEKKDVLIVGEYAKKIKF